MSRRLDQQLRNVENNFTKLVDLVIFYGRINENNIVYEIIDEINYLDTAKRIQLLIEDIELRAYCITDNFHYNSLWYYIANNKKENNLLIKFLIKYEKSTDFINSYLHTLNKNEGEVDDLNIKKIVDAVNNR